jgi:hypothetical protein
LARAVGPALAGALAAWWGSGSALLASALFFVWMIVALRRWPTPVRAIPGVPETLLSGVLSGLRYLRHSPPLRALVTRNLSFTLIKGVNALTPPSQSGEVAVAPSQITAAVATLLGPCVAPPGVAGFAEYVYVAAKAINGETRQSQYDASAAIAFVLAPA